MLRISQVVIYRCKRLSLSRIKKLIWNMENDLQIVLGTNGSGKSSLLNQICFLPANASDYEKDGYIIIDFIYNGKCYRVSSEFKNGNKHSFIVYEDEGPVYLNDRGTASAQRELVKQHFGITPEIKALIQGKLKFTDMAPAARQNWVTQFSTVDMSTAFKLFNAVKTLARESTATLKHINERIAKETNKLLESKEFEDLGNQAVSLQEKLTTLMMNKDPSVTGNVKQWSDRLESTLAGMNAVANKILDFDIPYLELSPEVCFNCLDDIDDGIKDVDSRLQSKQELLTHCNKEYVALEGLLNTMKDSGLHGAKDLEERSKALAEEIAQLQSNFREFFKVDICSGDSVRFATMVAYPELQQIFTAMADNRDGRYSKSIFNQKQERHKELNFSLNRNMQAKGKLEDRLLHIGCAEGINCPKCNHGWKLGVGGNEEESIRSEITKAENSIVKLQSEMQELSEYLEEANQFSRLVTRYTQVVNKAPELRVLWDRLSDNMLFCTNPAESFRLINAWQSDVQNAFKIETLDEERRNIDVALSRLAAMDGSDHLTEKGQGLLDNIESVTQTVAFLKRQRAELVKYKANMTKIMDMHLKLSEHIEDLDDVIEQLLKTLLNSEVGGEISDLQSQLAIVQSTLNQKNSLETIIQDLKQSGEQVTMDRDAYIEIMRALSPTDGFIAEQLQGAIHSIVDHLNAIISFVWTHDLIVLPCGLHDGELDYKFPFQVDGNVDDVDDIADGSSAQLEIFNLAFRLLAYTHLGLPGYPLFLDEIGKAFDEQHRINLMAYVKEMVGTEQFSQAFLISHYAANHGSFLNADVLVLNNSNITVPNRHNQHVEIEYGA